MPEFLAPYAEMGAALCPIPAGGKSPVARFAVFPIRANQKVPLINFKEGCSRDAAQIQRWATEYPGCNWAMVAGPSGLIVVDIDIKTGREEAWNAWAEWCMSRELPVFRPHVQTRSGGWHVYFSTPPDVDSDSLRQPSIVPGVIDTRAGAGGYVLIPPSTIDGQPYVVMSDAPPHAAPTALIEHCMRSRVERDHKPLPQRVEGQPLIGRDGFDFDECLAAYKWARAYSDEHPDDDESLDTYKTWCEVFGFAAAYEFGDAGRELAEASSSDPTEWTNSKWASCLKIPTAPVKMGSVRKWLGKRGRSLGRSSNAMFGEVTIPDLKPMPAAPQDNRISLISGNGGTSVEVMSGNPLPTSEEGMALLFAHRYGRELRYVHERARWFMWDGLRWCDAGLRPFTLARHVASDTASTLTVYAEKKSVASAKSVASIERLARYDECISASFDQFDADPWCLNTPGGIVDLRTGELRPGRPEDYMTRVTAAAPGGECPSWLKFLHEIMQGHDDLISFLQRMLGYGLTGITREHALFFLHGGGGNGKGVFIRTVAGIMGDYHTSAPMTTFVESKQEQHPTDLAGLCGARLVTANETEKGRRWAEAKIKTMTGGDRIKARFMCQDFFEYTPQFKLLIAGNHKPSIRSVDDAIRRRMNLIPFAVHIPEDKRDLQLPEKLKEEWPGILQWMIKGCLEWQQHGLQAPNVVRAATAEYLANEDVISTWIEERCTLETNARASSSALFSDWKVWAERGNEFVGTLRQFSDKLTDLGLSNTRTNAARGFSGIRLKPTAPMPVPGLSPLPGVR